MTEFNPQAESQMIQSDIVRQKPEDKWSIGHKIGATATTVLIAGGSLFGIGALLRNDETEAKGGSNGGAEVNQELLDSLNPSEASFNCVEIVEETGTAEIFDRDTTIVDDLGVKLKIGATKEVGDGPDQRRWSDALGSPMVEKNRNQVMADICEDPLKGAMVGHAIANKVINEIKVGEMSNNKKLFGDLIGNADKINDFAAKFLPQGTDGVDKSEAEAALKSNREYEKYAETLNTILKNFRVVGVEARGTETNYHLANGMDNATGIAEVELNAKQYNGEHLVFILEEKPGNCVWLIGFNTLDGRLVTFVCEAKPQAKPEQPKAKKTTPPLPSVRLTPRPPVKVQNVPGDGSIPQVEGPGAGGSAGEEGKQTNTGETPEPVPTASGAPTEEEAAEGPTDESGI